MRANIPYIEQRFREFNAQIFDGQLPEVPILLSRATTFVGKCEHYTRRMFSELLDTSGFRLRFSLYFDLTPDELDDVIIHEMIHLHIAFHRLHDTSSHGPLFRRMMDNINRTHGRHITISNRLTPRQSAAVHSQRITLHVIAVVRFTDGRPGIKVLPRIRQRIRRYCRLMLAQPTIASIDLFISTDPFFNRYPNSAALAVYRISEEDLQAHQAELQPFRLEQASTLLFP